MMKKIILSVSILLFAFSTSYSLAPVRAAVSGLNASTNYQIDYQLFDYGAPPTELIAKKSIGNLPANPSGVVSFIVGEGDIDWGSKPPSLISPTLILNIYVDNVLRSQFRVDELISTQAETGDGDVRTSDFKLNEDGVTQSQTTNSDLVFGSATLDYGSSPETKFFFDDSKGAFRTGMISNTNWNESYLGNYSFGTGNNTVASGNGSAAFGDGTQALSYSEMVIGSFNTNGAPNNATAYDAADKAFSVGNGTSDGSRSDAIVVYKNGNTDVSGTLTANVLATPNYSLPTADGTVADQVLQTDASGTVIWKSLLPAMVVTDGVTLMGDGTTGDKLAINSSATANEVFLSSGTVGTAATFGALPLGNSNSVSGILTVPNGGTGVATLTNNGVLVGAGVSAVNTTKAAPTGDFVGTSDAQSLTNKTIDADNNTISNIDNSEIKAAAGIDATKLADGSVTSAELQYINTVTSNVQTQLDGKQATLPTQTGNGGKFLTTDGSALSWGASPDDVVESDGTTITGDGTTASKLALKLDNSNTWSVDQTFSADVNVGGFVKTTVTATTNNTELAAATSSIINHSGTADVVNGDLPAAGAGTVLYVRCTGAITNFLGAALPLSGVVHCVNIDGTNWIRLN